MWLSIWIEATLQKMTQIYSNLCQHHPESPNQVLYGLIAAKHDWPKTNASWMVEQLTSSLFLDQSFDQSFDNQRAVFRSTQTHLLFFQTFLIKTNVNIQGQSCIKISSEVLDLNTTFLKFWVQEIRLVSQDKHSCSKVFLIYCGSNSSKYCLSRHLFDGSRQKSTPFGD